MIKYEVQSCTVCLFRAGVRKPDLSWKDLCLATRLGDKVGSALPFPTSLPDEQVPMSVEHGKSLPKPPKWCPLRKSQIVVGYGVDSLAGIKDTNLWPKDIGKK